MTDANYRGRHRAPAGRHRAHDSRAGSVLPGFSRSGYLLPTAAAATLVLTATGAHLGTSQAPSAQALASTSTPLTHPTPLTSATQDSADRALVDRAQRGDARTSTATAKAATGSAGSGTDAQPGSGGDQGLGANTPAQAAADAAAQAADDKAVADAAAQQASADAQAKAAADAQAQAAAVKASAHNWAEPIDSAFTLTSGFGMRWGAMHPGQDFAIPVGTPVHALSSGTVIFAGWEGGYGNKLEIQYWDGTVSWFAHNSKLLVNQGDAVTPDEVVSMSGNTGHSTGPHLHVEIHPGGATPVPPIPWLTAKGIMPGA